MSERSGSPDPERFTQITRTALELSSATDVALLQELVIEHLQKGPKVAERLDLTAHVAEHFMHVYPAVMHDPRAAAAIDRLNAGFVTNLPAYETAYLNAKPLGDLPDGPPGSQTPPPVPWTAVALGVAGGVIAGYYIVEAISAYCGDVHPPEGESAPVHC